MAKTLSFLVIVTKSTGAGVCPKISTVSVSTPISTQVTLLWGEELFLGWVIAGCFRLVTCKNVTK